MVVDVCHYLSAYGKMVPMYGKKKSNKKALIISVLIALIAIAIAGYIILRPSLNKSTPSAITIILKENTDLDFPVYAPSGNDFVISDANYSDGLFIYKVQAGSATAVVSQQEVPSDLINSVPASTESVPTPYGKAAISLQADRTTGVLIADKKTLISVNAPASFSQDSMKTLFRSLKKYDQ